MHDFTSTQLKIIVERAVRPVRASTACKRRMREELLAHVTAVFEEESARLGDEAALEQTASRFGNPTDVTRHLQESVPARDRVLRIWEGRPDESALQAGFHIAWVVALLSLVVFAALLFAGGWVTDWPAEALLLCAGGVLALPVYLFALTFLTGWMEQALQRPSGCSRLEFALIGATSFLFMVLWAACITWRAWPEEWDYLTRVVSAVWLAPLALPFPYVLAKSSTLRRREHEEWANLPIESV